MAAWHQAEGGQQTVMGLSGFIEQLIPKRWRDKLGGDDTPLTPAGSPDRMSGVASSPVVSTQQPQGEAVSPTLQTIAAPPPVPTYNPISANRTEYRPWHATDSVKPVLSPTATGDPITLATAERDALERWHPHRERGIKNTLEGAGRGLMLGGLPGAIVGGVGSLISPDLTGKLERYSALSSANENVDRTTDEALRQTQIIRPQLEAAMQQDRLDAADAKERRGAERQSLEQSLKLHEGIPFDPNDPGDRALIAAANKAHITIPSKYGTVRPNLQPRNPINVKNADGSTTRKISDDLGKTWRVAEGLGDAAPPIKPDTAGFTNEQITRNISDAANEQAKVEQALKDTAPTITKPSLYAGEPPTVERNPIYANLENRRNKLIDDQRRMRQQLKPSRAAGVPSPQTHVLSKSNWLKSHSASDWPKAVAAAKDAGYQIAQ